MSQKIVLSANPHIIQSDTSFDRGVRLKDDIKTPRKSIAGKISEDLRGAIDSNVKHSFTRAILSRSLFASAMLPLSMLPVVNDIKPETYFNTVKNITFPLQVSYPITDNLRDYFGKKIQLHLSDAYETPDGTFKDHIGSMGHIAAKTTDKIINNTVRAGFASALVSMIIASYGSIANGKMLSSDWLPTDYKMKDSTFNQRFWNNWLHGGAFGLGGSLLNRLNYRYTFDASNNAMKALGLNKTWLGTAANSALSALGFMGMQSAIKGNPKVNPEEWLKSFVIAFSHRLGSFSNGNKLPLIPGLDLAKKENEEKAKQDFTKNHLKSLEEKMKDQKLNMVENTSNVLYTTISILASLAITKMIQNQGNS